MDLIKQISKVPEWAWAALVVVGFLYLNRDTKYRSKLPDSVIKQGGKIYEA